MTERVSERIRVEAPAERSWSVATDFATYPQWVRDIREATVLEWDAEGRGVAVEFRAAAFGKSIRYVLAYEFDRAPDAFSWSLASGDEQIGRAHV